MNISEPLKHERRPHSQEASDEHISTALALVYTCNILRRALSALASTPHGQAAVQGLEC